MVPAGVALAGTSSGLLMSLWQGSCISFRGCVRCAGVENLFGNERYRRRGTDCASGT